MGYSGMVSSENSTEIKEIAWAQHRRSSRYRRLLAKGKPRQKAMTAIGRELLGFVRAIGIQVAKEQQGHTKGCGGVA
jgi:hypothetical protein